MTRKAYIRFLWFVTFLVCGVELAAAPRLGSPFIIDIWDSDDGLPQNSVISIVQSRDGYLWLGTLNGLVRFDGIRFTVFDQNNTPGLTSSRIVNLFEDGEGTLWVGTETAGIFKIKDGHVESLGIGSASRGGRLVAACEDEAGGVWLHTLNGNLWRSQDGDLQSFVLDGFPYSNYRVVLKEKDGPVWVGMDWRQIAIDPTGQRAAPTLTVAQTVPVASRLDFLLASDKGGYWRLADGRVQRWQGDAMQEDLGPYPWKRAPVSAACEDEDGHLLVGTLGEGVYWFGEEGRVTNLSTNHGLSYSFILSLHMDREGSLWIGTDGGGLNRVRRPIFELLEPTLGWVTQSVHEDGQGDLWVGSNGNGVGRQSEGNWRQYTAQQGLVNPYVRSVFSTRAGRMLAGTLGAGLYEYQEGRYERVPEFVSFNPVVLAIHEDEQNQLWVGTQGGLVHWSGSSWTNYTTAHGLASTVVQAVREDAGGQLWVGTVGGGLHRFADGRFTVYSKTNGFPSDDISFLELDEEGALWVGTYGSGLIRFKDEAWQVITTRHGLISNSLGYLIEDDHDQVWIGSNAGLMRMDKSSLQAVALGRTNYLAVRSYGKADGLPTRECSLGSQPGPVQGGDGRLWFPTIKGLVSVNPGALRPNPFPPPVRIEEVLVDGILQNTNRPGARPMTDLVIPAGRERLEILYTSLNLAAPDRARFKYRLEGYEKGWTEAGNDRLARYSRLPPGHYAFHVTASNEDGVWNKEGQVLAVTVLPPFWQTWWFMTLMLLLLLAVVVGVVHYLSTQKLHRQLEQFRQKEALEAERARIARDIHDQLGASLTQVSMLSEMIESDKDEPDEVEDHARQISQTALDTTHALDEIVWAVNPSNDTLDGLVTYICKYAQDYLAVAGLRYRLNVPDQLPETPIPPDLRHNVFLAAKEAITNVVRHAQASEAGLTLTLTTDQFILEIEDNGRGPAGMKGERASTRNGLVNMAKRMEEIGGSFSIEPASPQGTRVTLSGPLGRA